MQPVQALLGRLLGLLCALALCLFLLRRLFRSALAGSSRGAVSTQRLGLRNIGLGRRRGRGLRLRLRLRLRRRGEELGRRCGAVRSRGGGLRRKRAAPSAAAARPASVNLKRGTEEREREREKGGGASRAVKRGVYSATTGSDGAAALGPARGLGWDRRRCGITATAARDETRRTERENNEGERRERPLHTSRQVCPSSLLLFLFLSPTPPLPPSLPLYQTHVAASSEPRGMLLRRLARRLKVAVALARHGPRPVASVDLDLGLPLVVLQRHGGRAGEAAAVRVHVPCD